MALGGVLVGLAGLVLYLPTLGPSMRDPRFAEAAEWREKKHSQNKYNELCCFLLLSFVVSRIPHNAHKI